jgi:hypothetical protein
MTKPKVPGASAAMTLLMALPAAADTDNNSHFGVESEFLGTDSVQFGSFSVENEFLFFDDGGFDSGGGFNNEDFLD